MLRTLFQFENTDLIPDANRQVLSIRIGARHCCYAITDHDANTLYRLGYYAIEDDELNPVASLFAMQPELNIEFEKVLASYDYPQSILVPSDQFSDEDPGKMLRILHGISSSSSVQSERLAGWPIVNVYAVPAEMHSWMKHKFKSGNYWHQYSICIRHLDKQKTGGTLLVDLRANDFTIIASTENDLLLAQTFSYSTPEDVLYYLLKTCQESGLSQQTVNLEVSGLVDKQSALYKELYQYFLHIHFRDAGWNAPGIEYPAHFFTSLNDLAKCAS